MRERRRDCTATSAQTHLIPPPPILGVEAHAPIQRLDAHVGTLSWLGGPLAELHWWNSGIQFELPDLLAFRIASFSNPKGIQKVARFTKNDGFLVS